MQVVRIDPHGVSAALRTSIVTGTFAPRAGLRMLEAVLTEAGRRSVVAPAEGVFVGPARVGGRRDLLELQTSLNAAAKLGISDAIVELSSDDLLLGFAKGTRHRRALLANWAPASRGYAEDALAAFAQPFIELKAHDDSAAVLNAQCDGFSLVAEVCPPHARRLLFAADPTQPAGAAVDVAVTRIAAGPEGLTVSLESPSGLPLPPQLQVRSLSQSSLEQAVGVACLAVSLSVSGKNVADAFSRHVVRGSGELLGSREHRLILDSSRTVDAAMRCLSAVALLPIDHVEVVFSPSLRELPTAWHPSSGPHFEFEVAPDDEPALEKTVRTRLDRPNSVVVVFDESSLSRKRRDWYESMSSR